MLRSQSLQIAISESRQRLNEIASLDDALTEEQRAEVRSLSDKMRDDEEKYRAALHAEAVEPDSEAREHADITANLQLRNYLEAARSGNAISGREAEFNTEHSLGANVVPYEAIAPRERNDVVSPGLASGDEPVSVRPIIDRVFAPSVANFFNVQMPSVGIGEHAWPVVTGGTSAELVAPDAEKESTAWTLSVSSVKPTRLQARYSFRVEDTALTAGLEDALRRDLSATMSDALDTQIITGAGTGNNFKGFLATAANGGLAAAAGAFSPTGTIDYGKAATLLGSCVDGKYSVGMGNVRVLVGTATYAKLVATFQTNTADSAATFLQRESGGLRVSAKVPAVASNRQDAVAIRGTRDPVYAPVWQGVQLIRDNLSDAAKGWTHVTAISLVGFLRPRDDSFQRLSIGVSS